ncbi:hypothetical protein GCM10023191_009710 [Actinoallomurus oryzae]|uniref:S1 motif domain-containing protein n=1 Tax=Actinoallomurus oryzae TaxID=502180 RepID=A0ABP8PF83_9ACTN
MDGAPGEQGMAEILETLRIGDVVSGTVAEVRRPYGIVVRLDGRLGPVPATVGPLYVSWRRPPYEAVRVGERITAEVIDVDRERGVGLSLAATENPELWAFLKSLRPGEMLSGVVADVQRFGVFVTLDDGPPHPVYPGVGFVTTPELSWRHFDDLSEVVEVGQRVTGSFLYFDTPNGEARLSLRACEPDPFQEFADEAHEGQVLSGTVTMLVPFGAFVGVADGVEGLVHRDELAPGETLEVGERIEVAIVDLDRDRRRLRLTRHLR